MQGAAIGITCKDALMIFSQNETLALQKRVSELEEELAQFIPRCSFDNQKVSAKLLLDIIRKRFDNMYSPETRYAPVCIESDAILPLSYYKGCIWSNMPAINDKNHSLCGIVMEELVNALGDSCRTYCKKQCDLILIVLIEALRAAYSGGGWVNFQHQDRQECIIWNALYGCLEEIVAPVHAEEIRGYAFIQ